MLGEKLAELLIENDAIGMNSQIESAYVPESALKFRDNAPQPLSASEQGLPTM
jgi:hypothetical protein